MRPVLSVALLLAFACTKRVIPHNYELHADEFKYDDKHKFPGLQLHLGSGNEKSHDPISFYLDIGQSKILIGEANAYQHGIDCKNKDKNSCEFNDQVKGTRYYFSKQFVTSPGKAYFSFDADKIQVTDPAVEKMDVDLIVGGDSWWMKNWGIIGLAPQGEVSKYLSQIYDTPISILPSFTYRSGAEYNLRTFANPLFTEKDLVKTFKISEKSNYWTFSGLVDFISEEWKIPEGTVCVNTIDPHIIQTEDFTDRCHAVQQLICDGKFGKACSKSNANFGKAPNLTLKVEGFDFVFTPNEYLYFDEKSNVQCRFGDSGNLRTSDICGGDALVGVGLAFMKKYPIVFELNYGQATTMKVLNAFNEPNRMGLAFKALIVLGIAVLVIGGYLIYKTVWSNKKQDDSTYESV